MQLEKILAQHRGIEAMIREIDTDLAHRALAALTPKVLKLQATLLAHNQLEERELYPRLQPAAEAQSEPHVREIAQLFRMNMVVIGEGVHSFVGRIGQLLDTATFARDWEHLRGVLLRRIQDEEQTLHPLLHRVVSRSAAQGGAPAPSDPELRGA